MLRPAYCLVRDVGDGTSEFEFAEFETPLSDAHARLLRDELRAAVARDPSLSTAQAVDVALARLEAETRLRGRLVEAPFPGSLRF